MPIVLKTTVTTLSQFCCLSHNSRAIIFNQNRKCILKLCFKPATFVAQLASVSYSTFTSNLHKFSCEGYLCK